jgi:hypothetical protein
VSGKKSPSLRSAQENNKEIAEVFLHSSTGESSLDNFKIGTADSVNMTGQIKYLANKLQQGFWVVDVHIHPISRQNGTIGYIKNTPLVGCFLYIDFFFKKNTIGKKII